MLVRVDREVREEMEVAERAAAMAVPQEMAVQREMAELEAMVQTGAAGWRDRPARESRVGWAACQVAMGAQVMGLAAGRIQVNKAPVVVVS